MERDQIVGEPERGRGIDRVGREIPAVVSVPRSTAPSPAEVNRRYPRVVRPPVIPGMEKIRVIVTVIRMTVPVVAAIDPGPVAAVIIVRPRIIGTSAARHVSPLYIASMPSRAHDARPVAFPYNRAAAMKIVLNVHTVAVDGANLPVGTKARRAAAPEGNLSARSRMAHVRASARDGSMPGRGPVPRGHRSVSGGWGPMSGRGGPVPGGRRMGCSCGVGRRRMA